MIVTDRPATNARTAIIPSALEQPVAHQGLTVSQVAVRCVLTGKVPSTPAFSREVIAAYAELEQELTRGIGAWSGKEVI